MHLASFLSFTLLSPLIGQGNPPPGNTSIYFSAYLDRLIEVEETDYKFSATFFFYMTWTDPDAPAAVASATEDARKPGGDCGRWCENTKIPGDASLCCDSMFIPSLTLRNVFEYPQGEGGREWGRIELGGRVWMCAQPPPLSFSLRRPRPAHQHRRPPRRRRLVSHHGAGRHVHGAGC
jgi:hypothetical protein